ncbi:MAG: nickel pincer cofactor biosynthesis protein LarC [Fournierella sp.]|uniref:nickel pincer cofactor biosynthesis protein LarC n=1 Tax=Allofournierella sp. TaxID=1940256 RepID=UPI002A7EAF34|nr:nickel pincer cofactor biosynthesis protein LarC [Fournierella sp.]MDY4167269.1 nickel pincer cofactor biosynthesis protein LarC [Fournierella sp.]
MKTLYIECAMGAAGDMLTAALLDLLSVEEQQAFLEQMNRLLPGVQVKVNPAQKCGVQGLHVQVLVNGEEEHSHDHGPVHPEVHPAPAVHDHPHEHVHDHDHPHDHDHVHEHEHHHDHVHEHGHDHPHEHDHGHGHHHHATMAWVEQTIQKTDLPPEVKEQALQVYRVIAQAESAAHGCPVDQVHFHEVGALDAVADVTAVCLLLHMLAPEKVIASPVHLGSGQVRCAHGILPVPAPATAYILQGVPAYTGSIRGELCTPTGAALLKTFAQSFGPMPVMVTEKVGIGVGNKDFEAANVLRVFWGSDASQVQQESDQIVELRCNLDDMTGEAIGYASELLLEEGALDVYTVPIQMKKSRPAVMLCCLCHAPQRDKLTQLMLRHTTTWGVRASVMDRSVLTTRMVPVKTKYGVVRVKQGTGYAIKKCKVEYGDMAAAAAQAGVELVRVERAARKAFKKQG